MPNIQFDFVITYCYDSLMVISFLGTKGRRWKRTWWWWWGRGWWGWRQGQKDLHGGSSQRGRRFPQELLRKIWKGSGRQHYD